MAEQFVIEGLAELEAALDELPVKMQAQIYRALNRRAISKYTIPEIRGAVNYSSNSEKGIKVVSDRDNPSGVLGGVSSDVFWLRFADRGTASRQTEKGAYRGAIIAKDQIQPAILGSVDEIIEFLRVEIGNEMVRILEKRIKSTSKKIAAL